ncbi:MAG TPA: biotin--[acetyl-CoA-carboxylase] ligase [Candidatus Limnocylindria bacterium]|nr:biotin--[acetyl-CoA-carboxylase] ligase [Candidatus Limnocylindria bacterium]
MTVAGTDDQRAASSVFSRRERFAIVGSTNDVVRDWLLAGVPEVCLATADEQTAGRGREGRNWFAPPGAALLLSLGFRPKWLSPDRVWRLAALVSLAMCEAAEEVAGLADGTIRLKWPNDLAVEDAGPADPRRGRLRKLAGVLGETDGLGSADPRAVIGLGINVDWPAVTFPSELAATMTSLHEVTGGRSIAPNDLMDAFTSRLEGGVARLREDRFQASGWLSRQVTNGREVRLEHPDGTDETLSARGVDLETGALIVAAPGSGQADRRVVSGEIRHVRLASADTAAQSPGLGV